MIVSEDDVREALAASDNLRRKLDNGEPTTTDELSDGVGSPHVIFAWARQELTRRNDERAERLLPIDESWLKTRGEVIRDDKDAFGVRLGPSCTAVVERPSVFNSVLKNDPSTIVHGIVQGQCISIVVKTRGELLDWERALKGGAS